MPYNSETSQYERRATTVIDATPDGDTVAQAIGVKLDDAADDAVTDLNHHNANAGHYPTPAATTSAQVLRKSPAGIVTWDDGDWLVSGAFSSAEAAEEAAGIATEAADAAAASALATDKLYLGAKSSPPALDNQGDALKQGAVYYDSVNGLIKIWTGLEWVAGLATDQPPSLATLHAITISL